MYQVIWILMMITAVLTG